MTDLVSWTSIISSISPMKFVTLFGFGQFLPLLKCNSDPVVSLSPQDSSSDVQFSRLDRFLIIGRYPCKGGLISEGIFGYRFHCEE